MAQKAIQVCSSYKAQKRRGSTITHTHTSMAVLCLLALPCYLWRVECTEKNWLHLNLAITSVWLLSFANMEVTITTSHSALGASIWHPPKSYGIWKKDTVIWSKAVARMATKPLQPQNVVVRHHLVHLGLGFQCWKTHKFGDGQTLCPWLTSKQPVKSCKPIFICPNMVHGS